MLDFNDGIWLYLNNLKGKVSLVVNVATYCALTNQYEGLVALYDKYADKGFEVLGENGSIPIVEAYQYADHGSSTMEYADKLPLL